MNVCHAHRTMTDKGNQVFEIGLSMYSIRQLLQSQGGNLRALDYPRFAVETFGISQIDVWTGGFPLAMQNNINYYREMKSQADAVGSNIFLLMAESVNSEAADLQPQADSFNHQLDLAEILGALYLRVFIETPKTVARATSLQRASRALQPIVNYAHSKGLMVLIEPMPGHYSGDGVYLAELASRMNHPALGLMPDFGKMSLDDPYQGTIAMMPYTEVVSAKTLEFEPDGSSRDFDYPRLMRSVTTSGFSGIVAIEYEGQELGPSEGVAASLQLLERLNRK